MLTRRRLLLIGGTAALGACIGPGSGSGGPAGQDAPGKGAPAAEKRADAAPAPPSAAFQAVEAQSVGAMRVLATLTGPAADDPFKLPTGLAVDAEGNLYVADQSNRRICKFDKDGRFMARIGGAEGAADALQAPVDVALGPSGQLWALDRATGNVMAFERDGTLAAKFTGPSLFGPFGIAADATSVYIADTGSGRVLRISPTGEVQGELLKRGPEPSPSREPTGIAVDADGSLVVVDGALGRLTRLSTDGKVIASFDAVVQGMARIVRLADGTYLVSDANRGRLIRWNRDGTLVGRYGTSGVGEGQFRVPSALALGADGYVFVSDVNQNRVQKVALD